MGLQILNHEALVISILVSAIMMLLPALFFFCDSKQEHQNVTGKLLLVKYGLFLNWNSNLLKIIQRFKKHSLYIVYE